MPENPYEPGYVVGNQSTALATVGLPQITRAAMAQIGLFLVPVSMTMVGANFQRDMLKEFGIPMSPLSKFVFNTISYWPIVVIALTLLTISALAWYKTLDGKPNYLARRWWYATISAWAALIGLLLVGAIPPIYSMITGFTE